MNKIVVATCGLIAFSLLSNHVHSEERSEYWRQRVSLFNRLPISSDDIVFVGNSITDGGELSELLEDSRVKNRGINSDDIDGVISRIDNILAGHPAKLFLLIGINDVSHNLSVQSLLSKYEVLVSKIREYSPDTRLYIQSVMPINNDFGRYKSLKGKEEVIVSFNSGLRELALKNCVEYIDLWEVLSVPDSGKLNPDFTNDGLHLTGEGYIAWMGHIKKYVCE